ncbi:MAG: carboxypeptidase [Nitrospinae bacterium CG11_big_fil_rev_8_21_14_0_20_56_8]|nr:MAG: carboxypeptidase [Nitrospinae bacterium CG11_big_fil_rev_8_21_14_0_20_56_8]
MMPMEAKKDYESLVERLEEIAHLSSVIGILHWDQEVIMPAGGADSRARQMSALAGVLHEKETDSRLGELIERLHGLGPADFTPVEWCNIREVKRAYDEEKRVPKELVREMADLRSRGHGVWVRARENNRFEEFSPVLEKWVRLKTRWAEAAYPHLPPYDALIDHYERGMTMASLTPMFERMKTRLVRLIRRVREQDEPPDSSFLQGNFPVNVQEQLGRRISADLGFSFAEGRIDVSVHPFCGGGDPTDVRITTRYRTDNFIESLYAVIHETGHGLYEQGRMKEERHRPASESLSMGIHESQSLFWERMIAQNRYFSSHYLKTFQETFPESFAGVSADRLYRAINQVQPGFIRVEADEVTYPLHVILRYELEKGLFDGSVAVADLPGVWKEKMGEYLGIQPPTDTLGVLQDVHWSGGDFGYFPSYTLGALYACQFYQALKKELPGLENDIAEGNFSRIKGWLNQKIHRQGKLFSPEDLVERVTGRPPDEEGFVRYLEEKYSDLYSLRQG